MIESFICVCCAEHRIPVFTPQLSLNISRFSAVNISKNKSKSKNQQLTSTEKRVIADLCDDAAACNWCGVMIFKHIIKTVDV